MKTVFVLGAGSSVEADLPDGRKLTEHIQALLNFPPYGTPHTDPNQILIASAIEENNRRRGWPATFSEYWAVPARTIAAGMPLSESIDNYLVAHRSNFRFLICGKLAIVLAVLNAERKSPLYHTPGTPSDLSALRDSWFVRFWHRYTENCEINQLPARSETITVINFNYDRCFQQFLLRASHDYYIRHRVAGTTVRTIRVLHPYGSVGRLPYLTMPPSVPFGYEVDAAGLLDLSGSIRTFTETQAAAADTTVEECRAALADADRIVFLGFAFHPLNMKLLWPKPAKSVRSPQVYGTAYTISESERRHIARELAESIGIPEQQITLSDRKCAALFDENRRDLSFTS